MTIKIKRKFFKNDEVVKEDFDSYDLGKCSWYTGQNYFDEFLKAGLLNEKYDMVHLTWQGKNYEFKRK